MRRRILPGLQKPDFTKLGPPLKWAGGKRWLLPVIRHIFDYQKPKRLVEPFAGGLAVSLGLRPQDALLNDINPHAINFYKWVQEGLEISLRMQNDRAYYENARSRFNACIRRGAHDSALAAGLFYYLNRTGFNGLCRFNSSGFFNVPFGRYSSIGYRNNFGDYRDLLRRWKFMCGDFELLKLKAGDFIYADPPYDVEFTRYSSEDFRWHDQERLVTWLRAHEGPVLASNQATPRILKLYKKHGFTVLSLPAPRMISCNGNRTPALEMLAARNIDRNLLRSAVAQHRKRSKARD